MKQLQDSDPCPVEGKHFGTKMEKVDASFLDWLDGQPWADRKYPEVVDYIKRNRKVIDMELREQGKI